jgi:tRNA pseudouridine38-40 synthase
MPRGTVQKVSMFPNLVENTGALEHGHTFRLTVAYDGTDFFGWQVQPGLRTIQGSLAEAVRSVVGEAVLPQGSGRTDTGVHAEGQVVSLVLQAPIPADRLLRALNRRLPSAIRVTRMEEVEPGFHARANVVSKTYEYRIFERYFAGSSEERICPPSMARFAWDCQWPLQPEPMEAAAQAMVGTHDFSSFAASDPDRARRFAAAAEPVNNVRTVFCAGWLRDAGLLTFRVTGSGFLHHMVRNMVGTCVDAGAGRLHPAAVPGILAARDRGRAGATAPPQGLHLMRVVYETDTSEGGCA